MDLAQRSGQILSHMWRLYEHSKYDFLQAKWEYVWHMFHNEVQLVHLDRICALCGLTEVYANVLMVCGFCVCIRATFTRCNMYKLCLYCMHDWVCTPVINNGMTKIHNSNYISVLAYPCESMQQIKLSWWAQQLSFYSHFNVYKYTTLVGLLYQGAEAWSRSLSKPFLPNVDCQPGSEVTLRGQGSAVTGWFEPGCLIWRGVKVAHMWYYAYKGHP